MMCEECIIIVKFGRINITYNICILDDKNDKNYVEKRKLEFALLDKMEKLYIQFDYDKRFSKKLLQRGLQQMIAVNIIFK